MLSVKLEKSYIITYRESLQFQEYIYIYIRIFLSILHKGYYNETVNKAKNRI